MPGNAHHIPPLTESDANRIAIAAAGGILAIIAAMNNHGDDTNVNFNCCWALSNLAGAACEHCPAPPRPCPCIDTPQPRPSFLTPALVCTFCAAEFLFSTRPTCTPCIPTTVYIFMYTYISFQNRVQPQTLPAIVGCSRPSSHFNWCFSHLHSYTIVLYSPFRFPTLYLNHTLAVNDENNVAIAAFGGIEAIIAAMNNHPEDVNWNGCQALANLAGAACEHCPFLPDHARAYPPNIHVTAS